MGDIIYHTQYTKYTKCTSNNNSKYDKYKNYVSLDLFGCLFCLNHYNALLPFCFRAMTDGSGLTSLYYFLDNEY